MTDQPKNKEILRPSDAVNRHARAVLDAWTVPEEAPSVVKGFLEYEAILAALVAAGVDIFDERPEVRFSLVLSAAVLYGREEGERMIALLNAGEALRDLLDLAALTQDRLRRLAELVPIKEGAP